MIVNLQYSPPSAKNKFPLFGMYDCLIILEV